MTNRSYVESMINLSYFNSSFNPALDFNHHDRGRDYTIISSNYFTVDPVSSITNEAGCSAAPVDAIAEAKQQARAAQAALQDRTLRELEDRQEGTRIQPWLERMGWPLYLKGLDRRKVMNLVKSPVVDEESLAAVVWDAMETMLQRSRQTINERAGLAAHGNHAQRGSPDQIPSAASLYGSSRPEELRAPV